MKFNLLFVDDDTPITENFPKMLDWGSLSLNPPYTANSYDEALCIFKETQIDILVSDIEMLGYSGLDLVKWTRLNHPRTLCSFLTCHARFDFAHRAIELGTQGYLLKPIVKTDIEKLLSDCVKQLIHRDSLEPMVEESEQSAIVRSAVAYIHQNLSDNLDRETFCQILHISESKLFRAFNRELGMSVMDYIAECRVKKAMDFLTNTDKTISEICTLVGYNYPAHFAKMFRDRTGKSPLQFRKSFRKQ